MPKKHVEILPRPRTQSRRAASKEALKQMQLLLDDDEDDPVEIPSDDDVGGTFSLYYLIFIKTAIQKFYYLFF